MERKYTSQEVNTLDYQWGQMSSGDCYSIRKSVQQGNCSRDVATARDLFIETLVKINRSSSSYEKDNGLQRCIGTSGSETSSSEPHKTTLHARNSGVKESILDSDKMPETKPHVNSKQSSTQTENIERLYHPWWTSIYNWISCNSSLSTMFAMLMVGDGMNSPPRSNQIPRIYLTSPGGHERRLSPLSPPKPPIRSPRESIERIKAFPKIPKRQFTTPEKSPEKKQPLGAWNRQTSSSSTSSTSEEKIPCGGFRLLSPSKVRRPQRDVFSIPEKFEPAPSRSQLFDFSKDPEVVMFPSLMFKSVSSEKLQDGDKDANQPSSNVDASKVSSDVCHQQEPFVPRDADDKPSGSPENDNKLPEPLSNPESGRFPYHSTGDAEVPMVQGGSKNLDELCQLNESDPLQRPIQDAMKEFDQVFGKYTGNLENKIAEKLQQMEEFISKVRRTVIRVTDIGAIVSTMYIPDEVANAMARINKDIDKLKLLKEKLTVEHMRSYSVYTNLKCGPLTTSQGEKESSRLDDLHALKKANKELKEMLTGAIQIIESYRTDKKYVKKYVFGEK